MVIISKAVDECINEYKESLNSYPIGYNRRIEKVEAMVNFLKSIDKYSHCICKYKKTRL